MKNRRILYIFIVLVITMLNACNRITSDSENVYLIEDYDVSFTFPGDWEDTKGEVFDLQCTDEDAYASIFVYNKIDLSEGQTTEDLFHIQNEDLLGKRENVKLVSEENTYETGNKQIHEVMYSAELDGIKNNYYFNLIEFDEEAEVFAWVLFTSVPLETKINMDTWKKIISSAEYRKSQQTANMNVVHKVLPISREYFALR
ncbi:MAG: hypothetical protein K0S47_1134 [Herbinix sp.]|jgi:hypothetical protein|nr:hypothetical protein [Herbinix sp.]